MSAPRNISARSVSGTKLKNLTGVHLLTDDAYFKDPELLYKQIESALESNVTCVQLRLKNVEDAIYLPFARRIRELTDRFGATYIIDDRLDIAQAVDADGVHVGEKDISPETCRATLGPRKIVGVSTYGRPERIALALSAGVQANYIGSNCVYPSTTKPKSYSAQGGGLDILKNTVEVTNRMVAERIAEEGDAEEWYTTYLREHGMPVIAIGGVNADNANECLDLGAHGLATISGLLSVDNATETGKLALSMTSTHASKVKIAVPLSV
jgi:thiamine-phosphate diphosphorylase